MGWAKYFEDNIEIMVERQTLQHRGLLKREVSMVCKADSWLSHIALTVEGPAAMMTEQKNGAKCIICKDCGETFLFPADMQKHFQTKGWVQPKRCKRCREIKDMRCRMHAFH